jgi:hypothetical protein
VVPKKGYRGGGPLEGGLLEGVLLRRTRRGGSTGIPWRPLGGPLEGVHWIESPGHLEASSGGGPL